MTEIATLPASLAPVRLEEDVLSKDFEVRLVGRQRQHDQIGVESVDDMLGIGVVLRMRPLTPNKVHNLVLSLSRDRRVRDDDLHLSSGKEQGARRPKISSSPGEVEREAEREID
jgi:hypothetical protein